MLVERCSTLEEAAMVMRLEGEDLVDDGLPPSNDV